MEKTPGDKKWSPVRLQLMYMGADSDGKAEMLFDGEMQFQKNSYRIKEQVFLLIDRDANSRYEFWFSPDEDETNHPEISISACRDTDTILSTRAMVNHFECYAAIESEDLGFAKIQVIRAHIIEHDL